jgi:uncharacterized protein
MQPTLLQPVQQTQRTAIVDILRGWALLGVALMNYSDYFYMGMDWEKFKPDLVTNILQGIANIVFAAKSWTMLSFLFGYGFSVLMQNVAAKGINPALFFSRRMFWLFVLAIMNSAFFWGDILKDYAVMGMIILLFHKCSAKTAFYISLGLLLAIPGVVAIVAALNKPGGMQLFTPYFPLFESRNIFNVLWFGLLGTYLYEIVSPNYLVSVHVVMLCCFFFGMAAQKSNFFTRLHENKKYIKRVFWISLGAVLILIGIIMASQNFKLKWTTYYKPFYWIILGSMLFFVAALCWLYINGKLKAFFRSMQVIGKMTLTNYIVQNIIALFLFSGIGLNLSLKHRIHYGYYLLFAFVIYVAQVYISKWWLAKYQYGPVEWIWRQLSYAKRLPIKKRPAESAETAAATAI